MKYESNDVDVTNRCIRFPITSYCLQFLNDMKVCVNHWKKSNVLHKPRKKSKFTYKHNEKLYLKREAKLQLCILSYFNVLKSIAK